jgi:hypothetical protein
MNGMPGSSEFEAAIPMMLPEQLLVANEDTTFADFMECIEKVSDPVDAFTVVLHQPTI